jgi:hypothetical protein
MKKFYLRKNKKGKPKWCVKENDKFRKITKKEKEELQNRIDSMHKTISYVKLP